MINPLAVATEGWLSSPLALATYGYIGSYPLVVTYTDELLGTVVMFAQLGGTSQFRR